MFKSCEWMKMTGNKQAVVIGGGLAGCEAAWQIARTGLPVRLYEMRPSRQTPAHHTDMLAELVCSNSLGSKLVDRPTGLLLAELRELGSILVEVAETCQVPAGGALAVDREQFAASVTDRLSRNPLIEIRREELTRVPEDRPCVIATGPLTSDALAENLQRLTGIGHLAFFDALAPIIQADSIDMAVAYRASRYDRGEQETGDYINCPLNRVEYDCLVRELKQAETFPLKDFEKADKRFFEGCLAVEVMAKRGPLALAFGPLRPVGLRDPRTGRRPYGVVQLRQDNLAASLYNLVGFQTNLKWPEQERIFRLIPGLAQAKFVRFGQMHRNTFIKAPELLEPTMEFRRLSGIFCAGQLAGVEGYLGSVGTGWLAGVNATRFHAGRTLLTLPGTTMLGALCHYLAQAEAATFQPMKANFGLLPPLDNSLPGKRQRAQAYSCRALEAVAEMLKTEYIDKVFSEYPQL